MTDPLGTTFERLGPRMEAFLSAVKTELGAGEVFEMEDNYGHSLALSLPISIDVSYEMADSRAYEGDAEPQGCNPMLSIIAEGGEILGQIAPFNYTEAVWVELDGRPEAEAEIEARMDDIEGAFDEIVGIIREHEKRG